MAEIDIDSDDKLELPKGWAREIADKAKKVTLFDTPEPPESHTVNLEEEGEALDALMENEVIPHIKKKEK
jgi:hypothetical protein